MLQWPPRRGQRNDRRRTDDGCSGEQAAVLEWFTNGPYGGEEMLADDFVWHTPKGPAALLSDGDPHFGREALAALGVIERAAYRGGAEYEHGVLHR